MSSLAYPVNFTVHMYVCMFFVLFCFLVFFFFFFFFVVVDGSITQFGLDQLRHSVGTGIFLATSPVNMVRGA